MDDIQRSSGVSSPKIGEAQRPFGGILQSGCRFFFLLSGSPAAIGATLMFGLGVSTLERPLACFEEAEQSADRTGQKNMDTSKLQYAGFWKRFAAYCIDSIIVTMAGLAVLIPLIVSIGLGAYSMHDVHRSYKSGAALSILFTMLAGYILVILGILLTRWMYFALMESSSQQGTLGKMALSIKVTDMNGARISFGRATGRHFGKFISNLTLGIGYMMAGFTQQKQALHDIVAGCLVVNK